MNERRIWRWYPLPATLIPPVAARVLPVALADPAEVPLRLLDQLLCVERNPLRRSPLFRRACDRYDEQRNQVREDHERGVHEDHLEERQQRHNDAHDRDIDIEECGDAAAHPADEAAIEHEYSRLLVDPCGAAPADDDAVLPEARPSAAEDAPAEADASPGAAGSSTGPISRRIVAMSAPVTTVLCGPRTRAHLSAIACSRSPMISARSGLSRSCALGAFQVRAERGVAALFELIGVAVQIDDDDFLHGYRPSWRWWR